MALREPSKASRPAPAPETVGPATPALRLSAVEAEERAAAARDRCLAASTPRWAGCEDCSEALTRFLLQADRQLASCTAKHPSALDACLANFERNLLSCSFEPGSAYRVPALTIEAGFEDQLTRHVGLQETVVAMDEHGTVALTASFPGVLARGRAGELPYVEELPVGSAGLSIRLERGRHLDPPGDAVSVSPFQKLVVASWTAISGTVRIELVERFSADLGGLPTAARITLRDLVLRPDDGATGTIVIPFLDLRATLGGLLGG